MNHSLYKTLCLAVQKRLCSYLLPSVKFLHLTCLWWLCRGGTVDAQHQLEERCVWSKIFSICVHLFGLPEEDVIKTYDWCTSRVNFLEEVKDNSATVSLFCINGHIMKSAGITSSTCLHFHPLLFVRTEKNSRASPDVEASVFFC